MKPKISVIIPLYNSSKYINKLFDSIEQQTLRELEVIFIDDGSTDNSGKIVRDLIAKSESGILYEFYAQTNLGQQEARFKGLKLAQARKISFIDGDDWIDSSHFANLMKVSERTNADLVCANYFLTFDKGSEFARNGIYLDENVLSGSDFCLRFIEGQIEGFYWNKLFNKDVFDSTEVVHTENYMEDVSGIAAMCLKIRKVAFSSEPTYHYVQRRNSAVHEKLDGYKIAGFSHAMVGLHVLSQKFGKFGADAYSYRYLKESIGLISLAKSGDHIQESEWTNTFSVRCRVAYADKSFMNRFNAYDSFLISHSRRALHISLFRIRRVLLFFKQFKATQENTVSVLSHRGK